MTKIISTTGALIITIAISVLMIAPITVNTHHMAKALDCDRTKHTKNYCDGFTVGKTDCRDGRKYNGNDPTHTSEWRSGYRAGWSGAGCHVP